MYPADSNFIKEVYHEIWFRRNITGDATFRALFKATESAATDLIIGAYSPNGALQREAKEWEGSHLALNTSYMNPCPVDTLKINANKGTKETNLMAGHANADDIHPYSIYLVPLISY